MAIVVILFIVSNATAAHFRGLLSTAGFFQSCSIISFKIFFEGGGGGGVKFKTNKNDCSMTNVYLKSSISDARGRRGKSIHLVKSLFETY